MYTSSPRRVNLYLLASASKFAEDEVLNDEWDAKIQQLERKNAELDEKMRALTDVIISLKSMMSVLVSGQNGHSAMLESHRQALSATMESSTLETQAGNGSVSPMIPGPPMSTPDQILGNLTMVPVPPDPAEPVLWESLINLGNYGLSMDTDTQLEASSHLHDLQLDRSGEPSGGF